MDEDDYDLLVIGAGMAGLTAAAKAASTGSRVCVLDVGSDVGGSARFAGYVWTAPDHATMDEHNPNGDSALKRALIDRFDDGVQWIRSVGVDVGEAQQILSFGRGHKFDTNHYVDTCRRLVVESGGTVLVSTVTERLVREGDAVRGAVIRTGAGETHVVRARATLVASGGFQGDHDLLSCHVHPNAATMQLRSNPHSCGDGYRLAIDAGAAASADDAGFYGHLIPSGVELRDPSDFVDLSLYYSEHALLFNVDGERFVDETVGDHLTTMALLDQPGGRGLLVADARVHRDWMLASYVEGAVAVDKFELASRRGGRVGMAETLDELEYLPQEWGYDGGVIAAAVATYNADATSGVTVSPSRRLDPTPLSEAPYYVIETVPAITFPFHGIRIDDRARALSNDGVPVPGLLVAGSDTGGLWNRAYAGGLASALVFGLTAAETAIGLSSSVAQLT
ncbi:flavocytochrome c [Rhodococcoides trifolii]|uniref:Flavocytochrome c n=1 Tax=Rhodococcoides trifolii TaxID=908250 RepID=A0A917G6Y0_9NOCA|nr:FAD-binding protein [Rhodococcus trifolii]GGG25947.1 flavocytochrome c [Rhodococcus trifolii]